MSRKTISTSHTVIACAVCGRTLLRGEHAEVFITAGERRMVCELCTARAVHEGWLREGFDDVAVRRVGRSRSLFERLLSLRGEPAEEASPQLNGDGGQYVVPHEEPRQVHAVPTNAELKMERALELFGASEHAKMVSGVTRSLGLPTVTVRPSATEGALVSIVAAWEITWYRFEVDLGDEAAGVSKTEQGTELHELAPEDLTGNAVAHADGSLALA